MQTFTQGNRVIHMTYKHEPPNKVFDRWRELNPEYKTQLNLDKDCIDFLKEHFGSYVANLFVKIPEGCYKADLWRLCKLYVEGGVYADVDLVPHLNLEALDSDVTFYSCLSARPGTIFQALMVVSKPRSPLILAFIVSFLINNPHTYFLGPTTDMYKCLQYNVDMEALLPETKYVLREVKIRVDIGVSENSVKLINLRYFPQHLANVARVEVYGHPHADTFEFELLNNYLVVKRVDAGLGWTHAHSCNICIPADETILLFPEHLGKDGDWVTSYVTHQGQKILDSRDLEYHHNKGWK